MKLLKKLILGFLAIFAVLILVAGYFGLVPGVSSIFGSDKPRNLGIIVSDEFFSVANEKVVVVRAGDALSAEKVVYEGSHPVNISLSSEEISSLVAKGKWKYNPIAEGFQMKINIDGTVEAAGLLNRPRLNGYFSATGFSDALAYTSKFNFLPEKVPFYLNGSASIINNKMDLKLTSAQVGRVPLPTDSVSVRVVENFVERRISAISGMNVISLDFN
ncbi:MAG: hypothetical protein WCL13_03935, partial [bacterium]